MSAGSGTIFTHTGSSLLTRGTQPPVGSVGGAVQIVINIGLIGVAVIVTGTYVGTMAVEISQDHAQTWQQIDTITSQQLTRVYRFSQVGPFLYTDFRVRGTAWTSGTANIDIQPWEVPLDVPLISGSAGAAQPQHAPDTFKSAQATALGNTPIWTPAAGKRFRLLNVWVQPTYDVNAATQAVNLTVSLQDGTTPIGLAVPFYILKPPETFTPFEIDLGPLGYLSAAVGNVLNVNLSLALTAGWVRVNVNGTEE